MKCFPIISDFRIGDEKVDEDMTVMTSCTDTGNEIGSDFGIILEDFILKVF